ncbi:MAG TPA: hypothetical protein VKQ30_12520 [Ktedonobacterales bacterium]|nr:hypothetical protein [Ktedonobacterales bacterium]
MREPLYRKPASIAIKSAAVQIAQALIHDGLADDAQLILDWLDKREPVEGIFRGKAYL